MDREKNQLKDEKSNVNMFEVKLVRKDIGYKISAADVFN